MKYCFPIITLFVWIINCNGQSKPELLDYIILNKNKTDTVWCKITKIDGELVYTRNENDSLSLWYFKELSTFKCSNKASYYNHLPLKVNGEDLEYITGFKNGYAFIHTENYHRYIDSIGNIVCNCPYQWTGMYYNNHTWASDNFELYIVNQKCEVKYQITKIIGERGAVLLDSVIIIYAPKKGNKNFSVIDYNFNIIIPHEYSSLQMSSSNRYWLVAKDFEPEKIYNPVLWGVYDVITKKEIIPCTYKEQETKVVGGYTFRFSDKFKKELKKLNITIPENDEINNLLNEPRIR